MIPFLLHLLILLIVFGVVYYIVVLLTNQFPGLNPAFQQIVLAICLLIFLLVVIQDLLPLAGYRAIW